MQHKKIKEKGRRKKKRKMNEESQNVPLDRSLTAEQLMTQWKSTGPPDISADEIEYQEKIGGGCFGHVFRGTCRGKEVAIKKLFKQDLDEKTLLDFKKEVEIMR